MATIVLRTIKGSPLTLQEADDNFNNLNAELGLKLNSADYNADDVLAKLLTVDGTGSGLDADLLDGKTTSINNVANTVVIRDSSGNFGAGTITAALIGNVTGNVTGNLIGTVTGNASNVSGVVAVVNGGTGATSVAAARTALGLGTLAQQNSSSVSITGGTITGITDISIADGGTGASSATQARTNLGLVIGADVQPYSNELTALAGATNANGLYVRVSSGSVTQRSIAVGGNGLSIGNGDGISGNPTISISTSATMQLSGITLNTLTVSGASQLNSLAVSGSQSVNGSLSVTGNLSVNTTTSLGTTNLTGQLYVANQILATGNIVAYYSDDRLKKRLGVIENALDKIEALTGFYYEPNELAQSLGYPLRREVGLSAQDTEAQMSEVIHPAPIDPQYKTIDYERLIPLLVEGIKELRREVASLKTK
jgi:hypothetical protein